LIDLDLSAARLSTIAIAEAICELQLQYLCDLVRDRAEEEETAMSEIRRTVVIAVTEAAHVHGGRGFVGRSGPSGRVEMMQAILWSLRDLN
jgi:hypothetical protein